MTSKVFRAAVWISGLQPRPCRTYEACFETANQLNILLCGRHCSQNECRQVTRKIAPGKVRASKGRRMRSGFLLEFCPRYVAFLMQWTLMKSSFHASAISIASPSCLRSENMARVRIVRVSGREQAEPRPKSRKLCINSSMCRHCRLGTAWRSSCEKLSSFGERPELFGSEEDSVTLDVLIHHLCTWVPA